MNRDSQQRLPRPRRGPVRRFARWWLSGWWNTPRRAFFGPETRALGLEASHLLAQVRQDFRAQLQVRALGDRALTYMQMLEAWGISPGDVSQVSRMLRFARWKVLGVIGLAGTALAWQLRHDRLDSAVYLLVSIVSLLSLGLCLLVINWRLHCLVVRRYEKFSSWLAHKLRMSRQAR